MAWDSKETYRKKLLGTMANDGGDLWRNFCELLSPYSSYPDKKDSE